MARYQKQRNEYPMGSVSHGTMRAEDLIPTFHYELQNMLRTQRMSRAQRKEHTALVVEIDRRMSQDGYFESEDSDFDLESLFDVLNEYAGPYFYFGAHPGDGADYGYWLSELWDEDFIRTDGELTRDDMPCSIIVPDLEAVPNWFRGEVAVVNDHGNVTLYVKTSRGLREIWAVV